MSRLNRRQFLNHSMVAAGIGAGFAIGGTKSSGRVLGANDTIRDRRRRPATAGAARTSARSPA